MAGDSLTEAINLIKTGKKAEAQKLLEPFIEANPQNIAAWMWEADTWPTPAGKIKVLEMCLQHNPQSEMVKQALAKLKAQESGAMLFPPNSVTEPQAPKPRIDASLSRPPAQAAHSATPRKTSGLLYVLVGGGVVGLVAVALVAGIWVGQTSRTPALPGATGAPTASGLVAAPATSKPPLATSTQTTSDDAAWLDGIQTYYASQLTINNSIGDIPFEMMALADAKSIVDKSISGQEATVIATIRFDIPTMPDPTSPNYAALRKYFGMYDLSRTFEQKRTFLFRQYESGQWRFEREVGVSQ